MLQKFGEHIRGWFAGIVIAVIAVAFVSWGLEYYIERDQGPTMAIAVVNHQKITQSAFMQRYQLVQRQQEKAVGRGLTEDEMTSLKEMTLNQMINQTIVLQAAHHLGFSIDLNQIQGYIQQLPQFQVNGVFSPQILQNALYNLGYSSPDAFYAAFRDDALLQQLVNGMRGSAFALPNEMHTLYGLWQQHRDFSVAVLPIAALEQKVQVTEQQVQDYYTANKALFSIPAKVQVQYILLSRDALLKQVHVSDAQVAEYYQAHKGNFVVPASWSIARITVPTQSDVDHILTQLKSGKKLTALMHDQRPGWQSVTQTMSAADIAPALVDVLNGLHVGQVSKPLPTPGGFTVFEVLKHQPQQTRAFAVVKAQIKAMLLEQQVDQQASVKSEQLSSIAFTNPTSLDSASKQTGLPLQVSPVLTQQGEKTGIFSERPVLEAAFSQSVLEGGNNSNPISLSNGGVMVLRVVKSIPLQHKSLGLVKAQIVATLKKQMALREVGLQAYLLQTKLGKDQKAKALHWQTYLHVMRTSSVPNKQIVAAAFATPIGQYKAVELDNGYALIKVIASHEANWADATPKQKQTLQSNLAAIRGMNEFQIYVQQLLRSAKVSIKDKKLVSSWSA